MKPGASIRTSVRTGLRTTADPKVVLNSQILQLAQADLFQAVEAELLENPALERIDDEFQPLTREEILKHVAPSELRPSGDTWEANRCRPTDDSTPDWIELAASHDSLWDHLRAQLLTMLPAESRTLGLYLIGNINERGYLTTTIEEAALDCGVSLEDAEAAIDALRSCEPAGVGAYDLRDCLILQLQRPQTDAERLARQILRSHWDELVQRNTRSLRHRYKVADELIEAAFDVITGLNPFPGEGFCAHNLPQVSERSIGAQPDVMLSFDEYGWIIEIPGPSPLNLRVDRGYEDRYWELQGRRQGAKDEKRHITEYVDRARHFLSALNSRRETLARVAKYLAERQEGFVKTGDYKFLQNLTRVEMAKDLGLHESTISRATNGKFIQIATGEVVSFDVFFKAALRVQRMIEDILASENPDHPLSDQDIADRLAQKGLQVARRTVNKYRDRARMLSSHKRRVA